ncbi:MAG: hypothetical protein NC924_09335 [Candidatus Omnitrophica bacterium]|nr:hypothetical protein [Candidatus Omnitrophota bacterium]
MKAQIRANCIVIFIFLVIAGCSGMPVLPHAASRPCSAAAEMAAPLTAQEVFELAEWNHAAALAAEVEDYALAIHYYRKIVRRFPAAPEAESARQRLKKLGAVL